MLLRFASRHAMARSVFVLSAAALVDRLVRRARGRRGRVGRASCGAHRAVAAGDVDVAAPWTGARKVVIPVSLSEPAPRRLSVAYELAAGTAALGRDVRASSGTITFSKGSSEAYVRRPCLPITRLRIGRAGATSACDAGRSRCRSRRSPGTWRSSTSPMSDSIEWLGRATSGRGDGRRPRRGPGSPSARPSQVPLTLAAPATAPVDVSYGVTAGSAIAGVQFRVARGDRALRRRPGQPRASPSPCSAHPGASPWSPSRSTPPTSSAQGSSERRASPCIGTSAPGVADPLDPSVGCSDADRGRDALGPRVGPLRRRVGRGRLRRLGVGPDPRGERPCRLLADDGGPASDEASCATWSSQTPAQVTGVGVQQGLVLRAATADGVTRAITVTKNIWGGAFDVLNVHLWNTSLADPVPLHRSARPRAVLHGERRDRPSLRRLRRGRRHRRCRSPSGSRTRPRRVGGCGPDGDVHPARGLGLSRRGRLVRRAPADRWGHDLRERVRRLAAGRARRLTSDRDVVVERAVRRCLGARRG